MQLRTSVQSGPAAVLASGMTTVFQGQPLTLTLESPNGLVTAIEWRFVTDPSQEGVDVQVEQLQVGLILTCINFDQADGRGTAVPVKIGDRADGVLLLHFRIFLFGRTQDHTVHYTVYAVNHDDISDWTPVELDG